MSCPKNPKKAFWLFPYEGKHELSLTEIEFHIIFTLQWTCDLCGSIKWTRSGGQEILIRRGFDLQKLREKMTVEGTYGPETQTMAPDEFESYRIEPDHE